jgi:hypothetical protein
MYEYCNVYELSPQAGKKKYMNLWRESRVESVTDWGAKPY